MENENEEQNQEQPIESTGMVDSAIRAAERLEAANKQREELLAREEKLFARQQLGGRAEAGTPAPEVKEETPTEYMEKVLRGELNE